MTIAFYDAEQVQALLDYPGCIEAVRQAMIALSTGERAQPLRQIWPVGGGAWGIMPGDLAALSTFGAKLVSVFADPERPGCTRHQGVVVAYDGETGAVSCIADAEPITRIRTGCAGASIATDALAREDSQVLAVFGTGVQADAHLRALPLVRNFREILLWGRSEEKTRRFAEQMSEELGRAITPVLDAREAASRADVICTVSSSPAPILLGEWVRTGTHVNLVGSSYVGPTEVDSALVARSRYIADYRPGVLAQAAELAIARDAGLVDDSHVVGEIGEVLAGRIPGRENDEQVTIYKSLGHVAQDLASAAYLRE